MSWTTHYRVTGEEQRLLNMIMQGAEWGDIAPEDQESIKGILQKYPGIQNTLVPPPGSQATSQGSSAYSGVPLSQRGHLPDNLSDVSSIAASNAYQKTKGLWKQSESHEQRSRPPTTPVASHQPQPPMASPSGAPPPPPPPQHPQARWHLTFRQAVNAPAPQTAASPTLSWSVKRPGGPQQNPTSVSPSLPPRWMNPQQSLGTAAASASSAPIGDETVLLPDKLAWLEQRFEEERVRYANAMHEAIDAEAAMALYAYQIRHPELEYQEQEQEQKQEQLEEEEQGKEGPLGKSAKRRNRRRRANERGNALEGTREGF